MTSLLPFEHAKPPLFSGALRLLGHASLDSSKPPALTSFKSPNVLSCRRPFVPAWALIGNRRHTIFWRMQAVVTGVCAGLRKPTARPDATSRLEEAKGREGIVGAQKAAVLEPQGAAPKELRWLREETRTGMLRHEHSDLTCYVRFGQTQLETGVQGGGGSAVLCTIHVIYCCITKYPKTQWNSIISYSFCGSGIRKQLIFLFPAPDLFDCNSQNVSIWRLVLGGGSTSKAAHSLRCQIAAGCWQEA